MRYLVKYSPRATLTKENYQPNQHIVLKDMKEEDCKNCKDSTGGRCLMHSMFILTPNYEAKPRYIFSETYWMKIRNGLWQTNKREVKRVY